MVVTSTVLDVGLCLLLIGASAGALTSTGSIPESNGDEAATTVATTTGTVEYELEPVAPDGSTPTKTDREAHGTLAQLLSSAVVADVTVTGTDLSPGAAAFANRVETATRKRVGKRTQLVAIWEPYPGASAAGRLSVGPSPPDDADVSAAVVSVPSGGTLDREPKSVARDGGFGALATLVARAMLETLFEDVRRTDDWTGADDDRTGADAVYANGRRARLASWLGLDDPARPGESTGRESLEGALTDRVESDLRTSYDDPEAAASDVAVDRVRIVVRTW